VQAVSPNRKGLPIGFVWRDKVEHGNQYSRRVKGRAKFRSQCAKNKRFFALVFSTAWFSLAVVMKWLAFIIIIVAFLVIVFLRAGLAGDCIGIAGFIWYGLLPVIDRKRVRAPWASFSILFSGFLGAAMAIFNLLRHVGVFVVSGEMSHIIAYYSSFVRGLILGTIFLLFISGQMLGTNREEQEVKHEPAT
jgi:hypothetical protein